MQDRIRALVVDDDADVRSLLTGVLTRNQMTVVEASSGREAMAVLGRDVFDVVLADVQLPDHSGLDILRWARGAEIDTEFIVLTGHADVDTAVEAMRLGAYDFIGKPWKNVELLEVVAKAVEKKLLRRENVALREVITRRDGVPEIVGASPQIRAVLSMIGRLAASESPVLINGESGTGKELVARAVHRHSMLETELFGHKRGAFTGAVASRSGLLEAADGGTLFLDEIGEMSAAMQVRLLRTLDSGEVRRVGEERAFHVNVRVVAATNKDLSQEAAEGRFRWDLFYRVSTVIVTVPPLRERRDDVPLLVQHFIAPFIRAGKSLRFAPEAMARLQQYDWPGNIRELRNLIERLLILHEGEEIGMAMLPREFLKSATPAAAEAEPEGTSDTLPSLAEIERRHVERVLKATGWNKARAARVLEVDIKTLNKKIRDSGINRPA